MREFVQTADFDVLLYVIFLNYVLWKAFFCCCWNFGYCLHMSLWSIMPKTYKYSSMFWNWPRVVLQIICTANLSLLGQFGHNTISTCFSCFVNLGCQPHILFFHQAGNIIGGKIISAKTLFSESHHLQCWLSITIFVELERFILLNNVFLKQILYVENSGSICKKS